jgi:ferredoxin
LTRWRVALCSCDETLPVDPQPLREALGLDALPERFARLPHEQRQRFVDWLKDERPDRLVVGCCASADLVREAAGAAGLPPTAVDVLNLRERCFWAHPDQAAANAKAARLLRATMHTVPTAPPAEIPVRVGPIVLVAGASPAAVALARRLGAVAQPVLVLDERSSAFDDAALPWRVYRGRVVKVEGALGAFQVTAEHRPRLVPRVTREVIAAPQVVMIGGEAAADGRPARTGHYRVGELSPADVDALAARILDHIGDFHKPTYVRYDASTCAGGAAGHQTCGRCVTACPYEVVARDPANPARITVDHAACEGCGACVAVCPTSSLTFTEPPTALLDARLRALLAPVPGVASEPLVVAYHCPEQGAAAFDEAGRARRSYPSTVLPVAMACLRHVSDADMLSAFRYGAAGVALVGCDACPHGERQALLDRVAVARTVLEAFGLGGRIQLIAGAPVEATAALERFTAGLGPSPVQWTGDGVVPVRAREAIAEAVRALLAATGREPGRTTVGPAAPFAVPEVRVGGCTMCRACVNVCPPHAFRFDEARQTLQLRTIACVNCGLCASTCPESVIALHPDVALDRRGLEYATVLQDDTLACTKCGAAFGTRRAIEVIEAKLSGMASLLDTFAGKRRDLLRMCPNCRAVAAVAAMQEGWEP